MKIYLHEQYAFDFPSATELADMDIEFISIREHMRACSEQHKELQAECKGVESEISNDQLLACLEELTISREKIKDLDQEIGTPRPISAEMQMSTLFIEWYHRKRTCYDAMYKFSEQNCKKLRAIGEEVGLEFDKDGGFLLSPAWTSTNTVSRKTYRDSCDTPSRKIPTHCK